MTGWQIAGWTALALLPFWALGAYNRLVALRAALVAAWQEVADVVKQREPLLAALMRRLREPLADDHEVLDTVVGLLAQVHDSAAAARPTQRGGTDLFAAYELDLQEAWQQVRTRVDQHPVPAGAPPLAVMLSATLGDLQHEAERMAAARHRFNGAAVAYDAAIAQFPTRLLVPLFGFAPAGRL